jgi:hypothetical protein
VGFRSSIYLYVSLLALARVRTYFRHASLLLASGYCFYWGLWEAVLFFWGVCVAQLDIIRQEWYAQRQHTERQRLPRTPPQIVISALVEDVEKSATDPASSNHLTNLIPTAPCLVGVDQFTLETTTITQLSWRTRINFLLSTTPSYTILRPLDALFPVIPVSALIPYLVFPSKHQATSPSTASSPTLLRRH